MAQKQIELGRAVLATSTADLELWCKTLITISSQQQDINLERHSAASLLELLSSDDVWVGRGNGLHVDLNITFNRQPIADMQLQQLSDAILDAPASSSKHRMSAIAKTAHIGVAATSFAASGTRRDGAWTWEAASLDQSFGQQRDIYNKITYKCFSEYLHC